MVGTCQKLKIHVIKEQFPSILHIYKYMLWALIRKLTKWHMHPAQTQIRLGICPVWSESSLSAWRKLGSLATHLAHSEDSDQTGWMPRLIWVFAGRTVILLVLSWRGSYVVGLIRITLLRWFLWEHRTYMKQINSQYEHILWVIIRIASIEAVLMTTHIIWTTSWENLFMPYANNKGADQPAHSRSLIRAFVIRCLDSIIPLVSKYKISGLC